MNWITKLVAIVATIFSHIFVKKWTNRIISFVRPVIHLVKFSLLRKNEGVALKFRAASIEIGGSLKELSPVNTVGEVELLI